MSEEVEIRYQRAAEKILGNERLTADLGDQAAQALLDWALAAARDVAQRTEGMNDLEAEQILAVRLRALRGLMRTVSGWTAASPGADPENDALRWQTLLGQAQIVYGPEHNPLSAKSGVRRPALPPPDPASETAFVQLLRTAVEPPVGRDSQRR